MDWKIKFILKIMFLVKLNLFQKNHNSKIMKKESSIGYLFLQFIQQNHKEPIDDVNAFWYSAKKRYCQQSIRNVTQYKMQANQYESVHIMCVFFLFKTCM